MLRLVNNETNGNDSPDDVRPAPDVPTQPPPTHVDVPLYSVPFQPPVTAFTAPLILKDIAMPSPPALPYLEEQALTRPIDPSAAFGPVLFIVFCLALSLMSWLSPSDFLVATQTNVFKRGEWWRLLSSPFVHADLLHLASNSMLLLIFATLLSNYFGRWAFPVLSILGAAATEAIALMTYPPNIRLVGASGMVYLMVGMWLVYFAKHSSYLKMSHRIMRVIAFSLIVLVPSSIEPEVSYRSHAIGFALGLFLAWLSLPWIQPRPLERAEYEKAQAKADKRRRFLEEEDEVLTYLALRDQPRRQTLPGDVGSSSSSDL
ncbi:MAG: rhomboid family intramembrane serine protease [Chitinophagaceae bacterium]|nr:rhomboid family intramembrane serine protease [Oligoflexus sp.]